MVEDVANFNQQADKITQRIARFATGNVGNWTEHVQLNHS